MLGESAELANAFTDPTTDPAVVAESFARLAELFARLAELAPEEVRDDVAMVADAIIAVNTTPTDDPGRAVEGPRRGHVAGGDQGHRSRRPLRRRSLRYVPGGLGRLTAPVGAAASKHAPGRRPGHRICVGPTRSRLRALARRTETGWCRTTVLLSVDTDGAGMRRITCQVGHDDAISTVSRGHSRADENSDGVLSWRLGGQCSCGHRRHRTRETPEWPTSGPPPDTSMPRCAR